VGCEYYLAQGDDGEGGLKILRPFDHFFGAVGFRVSPIISLCAACACDLPGLTICFAIAQPAPARSKARAGKKVGDIDFVVVLENTEGEYSGRVDDHTSACRLK